LDDNDLGWALDVTAAAQKSAAEEIDAIASELNLLAYSWTHPEAFLERRNDLVVKLRRMARTLSGPDKGGDLTTYRPNPAPKRQTGGKRPRVVTIIRRC
jgi:hypothetical protein